MTKRIRLTIRFIVAISCCMTLLISSQQAFGQAYGVELHNTLMPASGGMGGTSIAQPQDLISAINGNPATMSQFRGTQFQFGGAWVEPTINLDHTGTGLLPGIGSFSAKSGFPGSTLGNIGITQDFQALDRPVTAGIALISSSGLGVDYVSQPNSNNSALSLQVLKLQPGIGVQVTDRLSIGANFGLGIGLFDGLFVGSSKATPDYGVRGAIGMNFDVNPCTKIGAYYQSKEKYNFEDAIVLQPFVGPANVPVDINADLPPNIAIGISNNSFANGRLLLAADFIYKYWEEATLFDAVYENQAVIQLGAQYTTNRGRKIRLGYVWAENPMIDVPGNVIAGITPPGAADAIQYIQGLVPNINDHRVTAGLGVPDVLPGVDLDMFVGGMFEASQTFGQTSVSVESYYIGGGLTWRFRRGSGCCNAPDEWHIIPDDCDNCSTCSSCPDGSCGCEK